MSDDIIHMTIAIPTDDDGYVLLQCPNCGTFFKATPSDVQDDGVLILYCPSCGLESDDYITEDVLELANAMTQNITADLINNAMRDLERQLSKGPFKVKRGQPIKKTHENPIHSGIEALEITSFSCCKRTAKIKPILKMTGCYCPFCGVKASKWAGLHR